MFACAEVCIAGLFGGMGLWFERGAFMATVTEGLFRRSAACAEIDVFTGCEFDFRGFRVGDDRFVHDCVSVCGVLVLSVRNRTERASECRAFQGWKR